jgi:hypothetical protein
MNATIELKDAVLKFQPLEFGVAGGQVTSTLTLDARADVIRTEGDVTVRNIELSQLTPELKPPNGSAGKVGGRARFTAKGNSVADMLGSSNGEVALISSGGDASKLAVVLTNLDLARATQLLLRGDTNSEIRCIVAHFVAEDGTMFARRLVCPEVEKVVGEGSVDFARERYDSRSMQSRSAPASLRCAARLSSRGRSVAAGPSGNGPVAARQERRWRGCALTPMPPLPLVDVGGNADADCGALIRRRKTTCNRAPRSEAPPAESISCCRSDAASVLSRRNAWCASKPHYLR